ncbi:hypothetical protein EEL36_05085 [Muribaculaceae bacterium Isolate-043 (Harlan)]|jgi:hypothetical protein|nr:hypothetical protein EEK90_07830 [Muribaculaceae bacterium Isolate-036 (Harlan)]ROS93104.1 hypothetical protein EEL36_05085 [Muribaculaceae bacterium Isolate-043 (Harlan)]
MSRKNLILAMATMMAMAAESHNRGLYEPQIPRVRDTRRNCLDTTNIKVVDSRQLREFSIKGHKVMAFSKKDAITRLKHLKKI